MERNLDTREADPDAEQGVPIRQVIQQIREIAGNRKVPLRVEVLPVMDEGEEPPFAYIRILFTDGIPLCSIRLRVGGMRADQHGQSMLCTPDDLCEEEIQEAIARGALNQAVWRLQRLPRGEVMHLLRETKKEL